LALSPARRHSRMIPRGAPSDKSCNSANSLLIVSSRFCSTRAPTVQAAAWAGVAPPGSAGGWAGSAAASSHGLASGRLKCCCCRPSSFSSSDCSSAVGRRARQRRKAYTTRSASVAPPSASVRKASARAQSRKTGSLSVISACNGVLERGRRTQEKSPLGASKVCSTG
jgi:hypothetical protein